MKSKKKKNSIYIILLTAVLVCVLASAIVLSESDKSDKKELPLKITITSDGMTETIKPWYDDRGTWYFFLPSYSDKADTALVTGDNCYLNGKRLSYEQSLEGFEYGEEYSLERRELFSSSDYFKVIILKADNISTMYINTASGSMERVYRDRNYKQDANITVVDETGSVNYSGNGKDVIKGRGNSTWSLKKKPFGLILSEEASLMGMNSAENWVLLANGYDETNLRNKLVYDFASLLDNQWQPSCEYVELYLNGEYNGLYLLSEKIEVGNNRISINNYQNDILFESKNANKIKSDEYVVIISDSKKFVIDYPKYIDDDMLAEAEDLILQLDKAITSGDLTGIDVELLAEKFLVDEVFLNSDAVQCSCFYVYDSTAGLFLPGPVWDYDLALGNDGSKWTYESKYPNQIWGLRRYWYSDLYRNETFYNEMVRVYKDIFRPVLIKYIEEELPYQTERIAAASYNNSIRWDDMFKKSYAEDAEPEERMDALVSFINERINYVDELWLSGKSYDLVYWYGADKKSIVFINAAEHGTNNIEYPPQYDGEELTWYYLNDSPSSETVEFDPATPITESIALYSDAAEAVDETLVVKTTENKTPIAEAPVTETPGVKQWLSNHRKMLLALGLLGVLGVCGIILVLVDIKTNIMGDSHGRD